MLLGFPNGPVDKESNCNAGDTGDVGDAGPIPGVGRSPEGGHGHPLHYFCLENPQAKSLRGASQLLWDSKTWTRLSDQVQHIHTYVNTHFHAGKEDFLRDMYHCRSQNCKMIPKISGLPLHIVGCHSCN